MELQSLAGLLSGLIPAISYAPFIRSILNGQVKPHRISWLIWSIVYTVLTVQQIMVGGFGAVWLIGATCFISYLVFVLSLKKGIGSFSPQNGLVVALILALLVTSIMVNNALLSIVLLLAITGTAMVFTLVKTYRQPWSETLRFWVAHLLGAIFSFFALGENPNAASLAFPVYAVGATTIMASIMFLRRSYWRKLSKVKIRSI